MKSIYELSEEMLSNEAENLYNSYYRDALTFINRVNDSNDVVQFLNSINAETFDNLFVKCLRNISNNLERVMNKVFIYAMENSNFESEIKRKYRVVVKSDEILGYFDSSCENLWEQVRSWNSNHQNFVNYHNQSYDNAFDSGYNGALIGSEIGSIFGSFGSIAGGVLGTLLSGTSIQNEYDSNYQIMLNNYKSLLEEFDHTWVLICENLLPNIIGEVDSRFQNIKEENDNLIREKKEKAKGRSVEYITAPNNRKDEIKCGKNVNYEIDTSINKNNNPIIYVISSALVFSLIFIILIFLKVIHIS